MSAEKRLNQKSDDRLDEKIKSNRDKREKNHAIVVKLTNREKEYDDEHRQLLKKKLIRESKATPLNNEWNGENFKWSDELRKKLKSVFKLDDFREEQLEAINCILSKRDVLMIAPTGGGKSLCYQLPALLSDGVTVVVSPLISLMEDQVMSLKNKGIMAEMWHSPSENMNDKDKKKNINARNNEIIKQLSGEAECKYKLFYVTPERLTKNKKFMDALEKCYGSERLHLIAIDEVHCCSKWGHDFRSSYLRLGILKEKFPDVPIIGVTATATINVLAELQTTLNLNNSVILKAQFNRPNLYYHVFEKPTEMKDCIDSITHLLKNRYANKSGIIYTLKRDDTEEIALALISKGLKVSSYHAKMKPCDRSEVHRKWSIGEIQAVIATIAFGMGIDKPNVRFVIHHTLSRSIEDFYQESGRAGRDNKRAECILLHRCADNKILTTMMNGKRNGLQNSYGMIEYAIDGNICRRDLIGKHFEGVWNQTPVCDRMCDRCYHRKDNPPQKIDVTEYCSSILKIIEHAKRLKIDLTFLKLVRAWFHEGDENLRVNDISKPDLDRCEAERIIAFLIKERYLDEKFSATSFNTFSYIRMGSKRLRKNARIDYFNAPALKLPEIEEEQWNKIYSMMPSTTQSSTKKYRKVIEKETKASNGILRSDDLVSSSINEENLSKVTKKKNKKRKLRQITFNENIPNPVRDPNLQGTALWTITDLSVAEEVSNKIEPPAKRITESQRKSGDKTPRNISVLPGTKQGFPTRIQLFGRPKYGRQFSGLNKIRMR